MRLLKASVHNFGSYKSLDFDYSNQGLSLVYGPTGAGKSTLEDIPAWILFGVTAKDGAVDEVRSWTAGGEPTVGTIEIELSNGKLITVTRIRGQSNENDLYWTEIGDEKIRGKDITETQKFLEEFLGISADLFVAGCYFHEFSPVSSFFTTKAKDRREIFDKIAPLEFSFLLAEKSSSARKETRKTLAQATSKADKAQGRLEQLEVSLKQTKQSSNLWASVHDEKIQELTIRSKNFELEKSSKIAELRTKLAAWSRANEGEWDCLVEKIEKLESEIVDSVTLKKSRIKLKSDIEMFKAQNKCPTCGGPRGFKDIDSLQESLQTIESAINKNERLKEKHEDLLTKLSTEVDCINPFKSQLDMAIIENNHYIEQLEKCGAERNPFDDQVNQLSLSLDISKKEYESAEQHKKTILAKIDALSQLYDLSSELRGVMLHRAVQEAQRSTNNYLEKHFDAEIRVEFSLDADSLDVAIFKNGHACTYKQLSKGQRQILKLCFTVSIMKAAANKAGVSFETLLFDESLDGLDTSLKIKAFDLFQDLEKTHDSVLLIDHAPEFHTLFNKRYHVTLEQDESKIELED